MKLFDLDTRCPKCDMDDAKVLWGPDDMLHRKCQRCGYPWKEFPLDVDPRRGRESGGAA